MTRKPPSRIPFAHRIGAPTPGRRARPAPPRASQAAAALLAPLARSLGSGLAEIAANWEAVVGPRRAAASAPTRLSREGGRCVLHIAARGPAALLIEADAAAILARLNEFCGRPVADRLKVAQTHAAGSAAKTRAPAGGPVQPRAPVALRGLAPSEAAALEERLAGVANPRLKAALRRLGRAALARQDAGEDAG